MHSSALFAVLASVLSLTSGCKDTASTITEKSISVAKDTTKGIEEGVEKGRKAGESRDGATVVSNSTELAASGGVSVYAIAPESGTSRSFVTLALENTTDKPLRVTKLEVIALDKEGFVVKPTTPSGELTVPPKAKEKLSLTFPIKADDLGKVRCWGKDVEVTAEARQRRP